MTNRSVVTVTGPEASRRDLASSFGLYAPAPGFASRIADVEVRFGEDELQITFTSERETSFPLHASRAYPDLEFEHVSYDRTAGERSWSGYKAGKLTRMLTTVAEPTAEGRVLETLTRLKLVPRTTEPSEATLRIIDHDRSLPAGVSLEWLDACIGLGIDVESEMKALGEASDVIDVFVIFVNGNAEDVESLREECVEAGMLVDETQLTLFSDNSCRIRADREGPIPFEMLVCWSAGHPDVDAYVVYIAQGKDGHPSRSGAYLLSEGHCLAEAHYDDRGMETMRKGRAVSKFPEPIPAFKDSLPRPGRTLEQEREALFEWWASENPEGEHPWDTADRRCRLSEPETAPKPA